LAGRRGWLYEPIFQRITELGLRDEVIWLDFVADADLPALYNLADCFAFPSIYEGFGIPALEALACGTPVVTADNSALPEIFKDVAWLVKAESVADLAQALIEALQELDSAGPKLQTYRAKGLERAATFGWEQAARQMLAVYQRSRKTALL
jgi:glycosyltransferase involved in cell wall biosynthesis